MGIDRKYVKEEKKIPFPDMRIDCYGNSTLLYLDGKDMALGVTKVEFLHEAGSAPVLKVEFDTGNTKVCEIPNRRIATTDKCGRYQKE